MKPKVALIDIALIGLCTAILVAVQVALSFLPNIELVTLLIIIYARHLGNKTLFVIYLFALLQGLIYGFHLWWIAYLYVWTVLYIVALLMKKTDSAPMLAVAAAIFGLLFGTLSAIPYFFIGGFGGGIGYILAGIPFDLVHCIANFVTVLVLFMPLDRLFKKIMQHRNPAPKVNAAG